MRSPLSNFLLCVSILVSILLFGAPGRPQEKPKSASSETPRNRPQFLAAKKPAAPVASTANGQELDKTPATGADQDSAELIRKREDWRYKQRSSANGHIPSGERLKAFHPTQRISKPQ